MARRPVAVLAAGAGALVLLGCRADTVSVGYDPEVGDTYEYRYEIEATITRALEGEAPEVTRLDTELEASAEVRATTAEGARIRLVLTREGGAPRTVVAIVDRAGSLEGVELVEGLGAAVGGLADERSVLPTQLAGPPDRPLAPGERWSSEQGKRRGEGRLERLGVIDGRDVAVVRSTATEDLARTVQAAGNDTEVTGRVRSGATTSYDLDDGAVRRSRSWSRGEVEAELEPPEGVDADPVHATIGFEVEVRVARVG